MAGTIIIQNIGGKQLKVHGLCIDVMEMISFLVSCLTTGLAGNLNLCSQSQGALETLRVVLITLFLWGF